MYPSFLPQIRFHPSATENRLCGREDRLCTRDRSSGQQPTCLKHIKGNESVDGKYIFKRCGYLSTQSKLQHRCNNKVQLPKEEDKTKRKADTTRPVLQPDTSLCIEHAKLVTRLRRKYAHRNRQRVTAASLWHSLKRYAEVNAEQPLPPKYEPPRLPVGKAPLQAIDLYSESSDEDEEEVRLTDQHCQLHNEDGFEPSHREADPLRHAGVYTDDEVVKLARGKVTRLQHLYREYFVVLRAQYAAAKAEYAAANKNKHRQADGCSSMVMADYRDAKGLRQLKAMRRYRRHYGVNTLLKRRAVDLRKIAANLPVETEPLSKCESSSGSTNSACTEPVLPLTKFCLQHVCEDSSQLLFAQCLGLKQKFRDDDDTTAMTPSSCSEIVLPFLYQKRCTKHKEHTSMKQIESDINQETEPQLSPIAMDMDVDIVGGYSEDVKLDVAKSE